MSTKDHITQLTAQIHALHAQLPCRRQSPPPPQPSTAPPPPPKPPNVLTPPPFSGTQDDLDCFKAECSLYLRMRSAKFTNELGRIFFFLFYMKRSSTSPLANPKIHTTL